MKVELLWCIPKDGFNPWATKYLQIELLKTVYPKLSAEFLPSNKLFLEKSLLNNSSKKALNDFFKEKENHFKTKTILEKLKTRFPISKDGKSLFQFIKDKVEKYEKNEIYICPFMKKRENIRGFKDGNIKLIWDEELNNFAQIDKKEICVKSILFKKSWFNWKRKNW